MSHHAYTPYIYVLVSRISFYIRERRVTEWVVLSSRGFAEEAAGNVDDDSVNNVLRLSLETKCSVAMGENIVGRKERWQYWKTIGK